MAQYESLAAFYEDLSQVKEFYEAFQTGKIQTQVNTGGFGGAGQVTTNQRVDTDEENQRVDADEDSSQGEGFFEWFLSLFQTDETQTQANIGALGGASQGTTNQQGDGFSESPQTGGIQTQAGAGALGGASQITTVVTTNRRVETNEHLSVLAKGMARLYQNEANFRREANGFVE